jgi:amino acid permease
MDRRSNVALDYNDDDSALDVTSASYVPDDTFDYISSGMRGHRGGSGRAGVSSSVEEGRQPAVQQQSNKASWLSCYINVTNTIVGSGMLGLPFAFAHTGWALGLLMLSSAALLSTVGLRLLALAAAHAPRPASFHGAASAALPPLAASLIDVAVAIKCFGVATSYLIIVSDMMPDVMIHAGAPLFLTAPAVWVTLAMVVVSPLSIPRSLDALRHTSGAALVFVLMCVALIVTYSTGSIDPCATSSSGGLVAEGGAGDACAGPVHAFYPSGEGRGVLGVVRVLPIFVFSFTCHQVPTYKYPLNNPSSACSPMYTVAMYCDS